MLDLVYIHLKLIQVHNKACNDSSCENKAMQIF